jgi:hypothetical protein
MTVDVAPETGLRFMWPHNVTFSSRPTIATLVRGIERPLVGGRDVVL